MDTPTITVEMAVMLGIALAPTAPDCTSCRLCRIPCPQHAAQNVVRELEQQGYVIARAVAAAPGESERRP